MTGVSVNAAGQTTNSTPMSLGQAIHALRPDLPANQADEEAKRAEKQATVTDKTHSTTQKLMQEKAGCAIDAAPLSSPHHLKIDPFQFDLL